MKINSNWIHIDSCSARVLLGIHALGLLLACGGGGSSSSSSAPPPPPPAAATVIYNEYVGGLSDIYAVKADGTGRVTLAATPDSETAVQVVGDRLIYYRTTSGQQDLFSVKLDGTGTVPLATNPANEYFGGMVGSRFVYQRMRPDGLSADLYSVNIDGTGGLLLAGNIYSETCGGHFRIDGDRIVFSSLASGGGDLYVIHGDGTGLTTLAANAMLKQPIAITQGKVVYYQRETDTTRTLHAVNLDGTGHAILTPTPGPFFSQVADQGRLVFVAQTGSAPARYSLYSVRLDGTDMRALATNPAKDQRGYRILGTQLIYESKDAAVSEVYGVNLDGTGTQALSPLGQVYHPMGLAGDHLVLMKGDYSDATTRLYSVSGNGSGFTPLTTGTDYALFEGYWGGRVHFALKRAGQYDLFNCAVDGTGTITLGASPSVGEADPQAAGDRIVYQLTSVGGGGMMGIVSVKADGSGPLFLATGNCRLILVN